MKKERRRPWLSLLLQLQLGASGTVSQIRALMGSPKLGQVITAYGPVWLKHVNSKSIFDGCIPLALKLLFSLYDVSDHACSYPCPHCRLTVFILRPVLHCMPAIQVNMAAAAACLATLLNPQLTCRHNLCAGSKALSRRPCCVLPSREFLPHASERMSIVTLQD